MYYIFVCIFLVFGSCFVRIVPILLLVMDLNLSEVALSCICICCFVFFCFVFRVVCVCFIFSRQQSDDFIFSAHIFVVATQCVCVRWCGYTLYGKYLEFLSLTRSGESIKPINQTKITIYYKHYFIYINMYAHILKNCYFNTDLKSIKYKKLNYIVLVLSISNLLIVRMNVNFMIWNIWT